MAWSKKQYELGKRANYPNDLFIARYCMEFFGHERAGELSGKKIERRLEAEAETRGWSAGTFNHYRSFMSMAYRLAIADTDTYHLTFNPARAFPLAKEDNSRVRWLSRNATDLCKKQDGCYYGENEYQLLVEAIRKLSPEKLPELVFAVSTGLRLGSQYSATYQMLDLTRNELTLPTTKNGRPLTIPLNSDALGAIRALPSYQTKQGLIFGTHKPHAELGANAAWFREALRSAGITDFKWHDLRHTFASWLIQDGTPIQRVAALLGHRTLTMTLRYSHGTDKALAVDVERLAKGFGQSNSTTIAPETPEPRMGLIN
jgi:integrase